MEQEGHVRELELAGVDSRVRAFACGNIVDAFAIRTRRGIILVDTLISPDAARHVIDHMAPRAGRLLVINTHGDWDHVWGNSLFGGEGALYPAPIVAHKLAAERMTSSTARTFLEKSQRENPDLFAGVTLETPSIGVSGDSTIRGGDMTLQLVETPGHTPDHLAIWIPELRLLLAGDAAEMPLPLVPDAESLPTLRSSLEKMAKLNPQHVLYCHARGITSPDVIQYNIDYFNELQQRCTAFFEINQGSTFKDVNVEALGWPLEQALPEGIAPSDLIPDTDFYRRAHRQAIEAMAERVEAEKTRTQSS
jgi:glyoxylase-like metal-dependent hydrolase (beta-lactamase superfamily II)